MRHRERIGSGIGALSHKGKMSRWTRPFFNYMLTTARLVEGTAKSYEAAMKRFWSLYNVDGGTHNDVGATIALFDQGVLDRLLSTPALSPTRSWTNLVWTSLNHFCNFHTLECDRLYMPLASQRIAALQRSLRTPLGQYKDLKIERGEDHKLACL